MTTESVSAFSHTTDENIFSERASRWFGGVATGAALLSAGWAVERAIHADVVPTIVLSASAIGAGSVALQVIARSEAPNYFKEIFPDLSFKYPAE